MKNILIFTSLYFSFFTFSQNNIGEKKLKLEIRANNSDNEMHRKTNDHNSERIDLKREEKKDPTQISVFNRHDRPHLDKKELNKSTRGEMKREHSTDKRHEQRQEKFQQRQERRENRGK
jgi:hypothetical protein